jgi:putative membrane protein
MEAFLANNPALNYGAYLLFCFAAWGLSLWLYEKATPYREWTMVAEGNKAAAWSIGGVAIALALPLASLAAHADGMRELALWSAVSLGSQLVLWLVLSKTALRGLKAGMEKGVESVGMLLGACAVSFGAMVAACVS